MRTVLVSLFLSCLLVSAQQDDPQRTVILRLEPPQSQPSFMKPVDPPRAIPQAQSSQSQIQTAVSQPQQTMRQVSNTAAPPGTEQTQVNYGK